jgi:integrase
MTATTTALVPLQPAFSDAERLALAGFLAGYRGLTREAYALDLRQFTTWCRARSVPLFAVRRADVEGFARDLEARGRARATVTRRLCTIAGFYRYAVEEDLLEHSPAAHVRRPRVDYESHAVALDRNELGALLVSAGLGPPTEHALISLLALNGLRVSEATGADIEHLGLERGHRTLTITRKGGKVVTIPLAPRTARAIDLAVAERTDGPVFLAVEQSGIHLSKAPATHVVAGLLVEDASRWPQDECAIGVEKDLQFYVFRRERTASASTPAMRTSKRPGGPDAPGRSASSRHSRACARPRNHEAWAISGRPGRAGRSAPNRAGAPNPTPTASFSSATRADTTTRSTARACHSRCATCGSFPNYCWPQATGPCRHCAHTASSAPSGFAACAECPPPMPR